MVRIHHLPPNLTVFINMLSLLLIIFAGIFNSIMDKVNFNFSKSIFKNKNPKFWNIKDSWKNQWKWPLKPYNSWYYFGLYTPKYTENFPYSSTFLVFITDAWHLSKALMLFCISLSIVLYTPIINPIIDIFLMFCGFTVTFTYFYEYILKSKD